MSITLEELFEAYEDETFDFATDVYSWFAPEGEYITGGTGLGGEGPGTGWWTGKARLGPEDFAEDYGIYMPTYDPIGEQFAFEERYLESLNAANVHNLAIDSTNRVFSEEMEKISGGLEKEIAKGKQIAGSLGLRSGTLESALESTMETSANKAKDLGDRLDIQQEEDLNTYNNKMVESTLDFDKDVREHKQDFMDEVMKMVMSLTKLGAFEEKCMDHQVMCQNGDCVNDPSECTGFVDICGKNGGTATSLSECEGVNEDTGAFIDPDKEVADCARRCGTFNDMRTTGDGCQADCEAAGSQNFNVLSWYAENAADITYVEECIDSEGNWTCASDDPRTDEEEGDERCYGCSWITVPGDNWYDKDSVCGIQEGSFVTPCEDGCCG